MADNQVRLTLKGSILLEEMLYKARSQKSFCDEKRIPYVSFSDLKLRKPISLKIAITIFKILEIEDCQKYLELYEESNVGKVSEELAGRRCMIEDHIDASTLNFVGREQVYDELANFVADPNHQSGYFCLVGYPGDGKTAIAANYVRNKTADGVYHFVIKGKWSNVSFFQENVCHYLLAYAAKYRCVVSPPWDGSWQNNGYLIQLLTALSDKLLQPKNQQLIIVVDALDEVTELPRDDQENLLCLPRILPPNVYFFVTQRPPDPRRGFDCLHPEHLEHTPMKVFDLRTEWNHREENGDKSKTRQEIESTINEYIDTFCAGNVVDRVSKQVLGPRLRELLAAAATNNKNFSEAKFRESFIEVSTGNFLYIIYVLADMAKGLFPVDLDKNSITQLPTSLKGYYGMQVARLRTKLSPTQWEVIYVTAYFSRPNAKYWPTVKHIARAVKQAEDIVRPLLLDCGYYLEEKQNIGSSEKGYWVYHLSFRDYLEEDLDVEKLTGKTKDEIIRQIIDSLGDLS